MSVTELKLLQDQIEEESVTIFEKVKLKMEKYEFNKNEPFREDGTTIGPDMAKTLKKFDIENKFWQGIKDEFIKKSDTEKILYATFPGSLQSENGFCHYHSFITFNSTILIVSCDPKTSKLREMFYRPLGVRIPTFCESDIMGYFGMVVCLTGEYNKKVEKDKFVKIDEIMNETVVKMIMFIKSFYNKEV